MRLVCQVTPGGVQQRLQIGLGRRGGRLAWNGDALAMSCGARSRLNGRHGVEQQQHRLARLGVVRQPVGLRLRQRRRLRGHQHVQIRRISRVGRYRTTSYCLRSSATMDHSWFCRLL